MKYTLEEKLKYVRLHLDDGVPIHEIEKKYGLDPSMLKFYCNMYLKWGEQAFKIDWKRRAYTREMKLAAIHDVIVNGKSYYEVAVERMITNPKIIGDWMVKYRNGGEEAIQETYTREAYKHHDDKLLEKNYKKLLEDLERTKAENEYLKKSYSLILKRSKQQKKK